MKPPRLWPDALRHTRLMTWAPLLIPVLLGLTVADRWYPGYAEHRERHADAESRLARAQAVADLKPRYDEKIAAQTEAVAMAQGHALVNETVEASVSQLQTHLQSMIVAEFIEEVPQLDITPDAPIGPASVLRVEWRLLVSPQQLAGLEARLLPFKDRLRPVTVTLKVVPDPKRASQQLEAHLRFHALHIDAAAVVSAPPAAPAPSSPPAPASTTQAKP
jgi:hypothetical protein